MSQQPDFGGLGRHYLQAESYGVAAFCFYRAIIEDRDNGNAWNGLILALSLMRKEQDATTVLARFGFQQQLPYDRDMITFAMMMLQHSPSALAEWVRGVMQMNGINDQDKEVLTELEASLEQSHLELVAKYGEETMREQGVGSLADFAARRIELDWLMEEPFDNVYEQLKLWLEQPELVLAAVRTLCMMPDPRSEKLLRRVCRNEELDGKVRTHAMLALRWLGVRGNVRMMKFGESFVINLDNPEPELAVSVPVVFKPVLDRFKLWLAKEQGVVTLEEYESHASTDEVELPAALAAKLEEAEVPSTLQEVAHMLIRAAYDQFYPLVPTVTGMRQWAAALLILAKDYASQVRKDWKWGNPEQDEMVIRHRNWLLSGSPDFYDSIEDARKQFEAVNG